MLVAGFKLLTSLNRHLFVVLPQRFDLLFVQLLEVNKVIPGPGDSSDKFVEFELDGCRVAVLRVLNYEHHQERYDRGAGVNHELPGVRIMEHRTEGRPDNNGGGG